MTKKELIFNAAAKLFAIRSFYAVGIRDIATEAGVNSAMISYYYGGKSGLLQDIFERFVSLLLTDMRLSMEEAHNHNELCRYFVRRCIGSARSNRDVYLVGLFEINRGHEELQNLNNELDEKSWEMFQLHIDRLGIKNVRDDETRDINFVAILGMIFSDYLLGHGTFIDSDERVEGYTEKISGMLQFGLPKHWE